MIRALAVACLLVADALALYVAAEWVAAAYDETIGTVPAVLFMLVALSGFAVAWFANEWELDPLRAAAAIGVVAFVTIYGSLRLTFAGDLALWNFAWVADVLDGVEATLRENPAVLPAAVLVVAAWVRGTSRARNEVELEMVPRNTTLPFIAVTAIVILAAGSDRSGEVARGGAVFYAVAVLTLACSQLALSGATFGDLQAGSVISVLLGLTAAATVVCVALFWVVFGLFGDTLGPLLANTVELILLVVLTPPAWLLEKLMRLLFSGAEFPQLTESLRETISDSNASAEPGEPGNAERLGRYFFRALGLLIMLALGAGVIAWYARLRRRPPAHAVPPPTGAGAGSLGEDFRGIFRRLFGRRPRPQRAATTGSEVERLYLEALVRAQRAGLPRQPAETPEEYAPRLQDALRMPATAELTLAFEEARYGNHAVDPGRIAELDHRLREGP
ncbi:MAG: DUF4129 domain-containing protein [Dehalococcoidia bacterium]|nr:DUF4129 domain-containing protein [Dehalococcoidia bacterium]